MIATGAWRLELPSRALALENLAIALPTVPHSVALYVMSAGDRVVVERLEGIAAVGRYHVAYVVGSVDPARRWQSTTHGRHLCSAPVQRAVDVLPATTTAVARVGAIASVGLALVAPLALTVAAPDNYALGGLSEVSASSRWQLCPTSATWRAPTSSSGWRGRRSSLL